MTNIRGLSIAILGGAGQRGAALAARFARSGQRVIIGSRDVVRAEAAATQISAAGSGVVSGLSNLDAAWAGDVIILAVAYRAQRAIAVELAGALRGKILIDVTVPLAPAAADRVQLPDGGSAVMALQTALGDEVRVVSAFQNVPTEQLVARGKPVDCDVLVCGDDEEARETVCLLARRIGLPAWQAGSLANSVATEALTSLLMSISARYRVPSGAGIKITGIPNRLFYSDLTR